MKICGCIGSQAHTKIAGDQSRPATVSGPLAQPVMAYWTGRVSKSASASAMHMRSKRAFIVLEARRYQVMEGCKSSSPTGERLLFAPQARLLPVLWVVMKSKPEAQTLRRIR